MAHPHPYGEATVALFLSTAPILAVVGLLVGDRVEAFRRSGRPPKAPSVQPLPRLEPAVGVE